MAQPRRPRRRPRGPRPERVPAGRPGDGGRRGHQPPLVPQGDGGQRGPRGHDRLPPARRDHPPVRPQARRRGAGRADLLRDRDAARRRRARAAGAEPRGAADQGRGQPRAPGLGWVDGHLRAGVRPAALRSGPQPPRLDARRGRARPGRLGRLRGRRGTPPRPARRGRGARRALGVAHGRRAPRPLPRRHARRALDHAPPPPRRPPGARHAAGPRPAGPPALPVRPGGRDRLPRRGLHRCRGPQLGLEQPPVRCLAPRRRARLDEPPLRHRVDHDDDGRHGGPPQGRQGGRGPVRGRRHRQRSRCLDGRLAHARGGHAAVRLRHRGGRAGGRGQRGLRRGRPPARRGARPRGRPQRSVRRRRRGVPRHGRRDRRAGRPAAGGPRPRHAGRAGGHAPDAGHQPGPHAPRRPRLRGGAGRGPDLDPRRPLPRRDRPARNVARPAHPLPRELGRRPCLRRHAEHRPAAHRTSLRRRALGPGGPQHAYDRPQQRRVRPPPPVGSRLAHGSVRERVADGPPRRLRRGYRLRVARLRRRLRRPLRPRRARGGRHGTGRPHQPHSLRRRVLERRLDAGDPAPRHESDLGSGGPGVARDGRRARRRRGEPLRIRPRRARPGGPLRRHGSRRRQELRVGDHADGWRGVGGVARVGPARPPRQLGHGVPRLRS